MPADTSRSHRQPGFDYQSKANGSKEFGNTSQEHDEWEPNPASDFRHPRGFLHYQSCSIKPQTTLPLRGADVNGCCRVVDITDGDPSHADTSVPPPTSFSLPKDGTIPDSFDMPPPYRPSTHHETSDTLPSEHKHLGPACLQGVGPIVHQQFDAVFEQVQDDLAQGILPAWVYDGDTRGQPSEWPASTAPPQSYGQASNTGTKRPASPLQAFDFDTSQHDKRQKFYPTRSPRR